MHLPSHFLAGWILSEIKPLEKRDRWIIALSSVFPDIDGIPIVFGVEAYQKWHHSFGHSLLAGLGLALLVYFLSVRKAWVTILSLVSFHVHIALDYFGSGGPYGSIWSIKYLWPFSEQGYFPSFQWALHSPINISLTIFFMVIVIILGARRERSPFEIISASGDSKVVWVFKRWCRMKDENGKD